MNLLITLDIKFKTNNEKIINILKDYGLKQIQRNCFYGNIDKNEENKFKKLLNENIKPNDSLIILPLCNSCFIKKEVYGREIKFQKEYYKIL